MTHVNKITEQLSILKRIKTHIKVLGLMLSTYSLYLFKYTSKRLFHDLCNKMKVLPSNILNNGVKQIKGWQL